MAFMMKVGTDDTLMQREYLTRVYRMLTGTKFSNPALNQSAKTLTIPFDLSSFETFIKRDNHLRELMNNSDMKSVIQGLLNQIDVQNLSNLQFRQMRFLLAKYKITAAEVHRWLQNDTKYNQWANLLRWPIVVPGYHDRRQQTLGFAMHGDDYSGQPDRTPTNPDRTDYRQDDLRIDRFGPSIRMNRQSSPASSLRYHW